MVNIPSLNDMCLNGILKFNFLSLIDQLVQKLVRTIKAILKKSSVILLAEETGSCGK